MSLRCSWYDLILLILNISWHVKTDQDEDSIENSYTTIIITLGETKIIFIMILSYYCILINPHFRCVSSSHPKAHGYLEEKGQ